MVVQDPQNRIFIVRNNGFAAYGALGKFKVLEVVDTLELGSNCAHYESDSKQILGWKKEVMARQDNSSFAAAVFFNVPANNVLSEF